MWKIYSYGKSNNAQYSKWLKYFIKKSDNWFKIYEWVNGFQGFIGSVQDAFVILETCFPAKSNSKITLSQILHFFVRSKVLKLNQILRMLADIGIKINMSTLWEYTGWLMRMNIIRKKRMSDNSNIYILNENIKEWKLPYRPELNSHYSNRKNL